MMMDDNDGQMVFGDLGGLKLPDIHLTGEEKPRKNLTQESCHDRGSNPGPLRDKRACYRLLHSGWIESHNNQTGALRVFAPIVSLRKMVERFWADLEYELKKIFFCKYTFPKFRWLTNIQLCKLYIFFWYILLYFFRLIRPFKSI